MRHLCVLVSVLAVTVGLCGLARADEGAIEGEIKAPRQAREGGEGARADRPREGDRGGTSEEAKDRPRRSEGGGDEAAGGAAAALPRDIARMAEGLKATPDQIKQLESQVEARVAAVAQWNKDNEARLRELREQVRKAQDSLRGLEEERRKIELDSHAAMLAVFTPMQLATWETQKIRDMYTRAGESSIGVTQAQYDRIVELCDKAARELVDVASARPADPDAAKKEALANLAKEIYENVLDDDQRTRAPKPPTIRAKGGEGEGEAAPRPKDQPRRRAEGEGEGR